MTEVFNSWSEVEKTYFPRDYALSLAKIGEVDELAKYIIEDFE